MDEEAVAIAAQVARTLDDLGIAFVLRGSAASSHHGLPRSTNDVDFVADVRAADVPNLLAALEDEFHVDASAVTEAIAREGSFNIVHYETATKLAIFVAGADQFRQAELRNAVTGRVLGYRFRFASPEDTILAKLRWFRDGAEVSDRQWSDVLGVIAVQRERLDLDYLRVTACELGVADLLDRALSSATG